MTADNIATLPLDRIRLDGGTQSRAAIHEPTVSEYAEALEGGAEFPPIEVCLDGSDYWPWDGFHRLLAHKRAGKGKIRARVTTGSRRDAVLLSLGANASHGLRRTNDDKRRSVLAMLADAEWSSWSDREIARRCGVTHPFVAALRSPERAAKQQAARDASSAPQDAAQVESITTRDHPQTTSPAPTTTGSSLPAAVPPAVLEQHAPGPATIVQQQEVESVTTDPHSGPDLAELVDQLQEDLRRAESRIEELQAALASGGQERLVAAMLRADHAERRLAEVMQDSAAAKRRADFGERQLARIGRAVGEKDLDRVAPKVEAMAREAKQVQA